MQENKIYELFKVEAEKTIERLEEMKKHLIKEFNNSPDRDSKEEVILRKYCLILLQERIKRLIEKLKLADIQRWTKLEVAIRSALDNNDIESFTHEDLVVKYGID